MMRRILLSATLALVCASTSHAAMRLSTNGMGQVLLFPYYTVQGGQSTLITLVNTTDRAKLLDFRFNEALNGRTVLGTGLFLGPHDTWVGAVFATGLNGPANLVTDDRSCLFSGNEHSSVLPDGRVYYPFRPYNYTGENADGGPTALNRTREGSLDVVELAQVERGSTLEAALTSASGQPDCAAATSHDLMGMMEAPGGGVSGSFAIVDAMQGSVMAGQPTVVDGFSVLPVLTRNGSIEVLDRGYTSTDPNDAAVEALVPVGDKLLSMKYSRAIDALSALLMTDTLFGDFMKDPSAGADTDWVVAAPTRKFYADARSTPRPPVDLPWREGEYLRRYSCMPYKIALRDREQRVIRTSSELIGVPPANYRHMYNLCLSVDVLRFDERGNELPPGEDPGSPDASNRVSQAVGSRLSAPAALLDDGNAVKFGAAQLSLSTNEAPAFLPAGISGPALRGLPVIGFEATKYVSGSIGGVLANYTYAVPLHSRTSCASASGAAVACP